jgi:hypothetical protein
MLIVWIIINLPLVVDAYHERRRIEAATHLSKQLDWAARVATADANTLSMRLTTGCASILETIRREGGSTSTLYVFTPNAIYFQADQLKPADAGRGAVQQSLDVLHSFSAPLRTATRTFPGEARFILADAGSNEVKGWLGERAHLLGVTREHLIHINEGGVRWVKKIRRGRHGDVPTMATSLRLARRAPGFRFLLRDDDNKHTGACFMQPFDEASAGVLQPIYLLSQQQSPVLYAMIRDCLEGLHAVL